MYGYAVGVIGLRPDDFRTMTRDEFDAVWLAFNKEKEYEIHDGWERTRMHASICIQPHVRKKVQPKDLMKFPWDEKKKKQDKPIPSRAEAMKQYNDLMERLNKNKENGTERPQI